MGEKRFETVEQLVADGLIHFYIESRAADYIASLSDESNYAQSPYLAYSVKKKRLQKSKKNAANHKIDLPDGSVGRRQLEPPTTVRSSVTHTRTKSWRYSKTSKVWSKNIYICENSD